MAVFRGRKIRRIIYGNEWWFSVVDVCGGLTDSPSAGAYWRKLKQRLNEEGNEVVTNCHGLKLMASDGKMYETDCANTEGIFRIIQSIPSPKAEPFKRWLAKVGYERVQEIENPDLAIKRTRFLYKAKGYSESWIEKRMIGITERGDLTQEWDKRGVKNEKEYAILTAEIFKAAFGIMPSQYKELKKMKSGNLRDNMNGLELVLAMLGEVATEEIIKARDSKGFQKLKIDAKDGGGVAGEARKNVEKLTGKKFLKRNGLKEKSFVEFRGDM